MFDVNSLNLRGIPAAVLLGEDKAYIQVYYLYRARMAEEIMKQLNRSFWERANGETDDLGNVWKPLKKRTRQIKRNLTEHLSNYRLFRDWYKYVTNESGLPTDAAAFVGSLERGILTPAQRQRFESAYKIALGEGTSSYAKKLARDAAWASVMAFNPERDDVSDLINIRTGRLVAATSPGVVRGNRYYPPPDQEFSLNPFSISLNVDYAGAVDELRTLIPDDISEWIQKAHEACIDEVLSLYHEIRLTFKPKRARKPKPKLNRYRFDGMTKAQLAKVTEIKENYLARYAGRLSFKVVNNNLSEKMVIVYLATKIGRPAKLFQSVYRVGIRGGIKAIRKEF